MSEGRRLRRLALQEGLREAARRLRLARLLPVDGRHRAKARPGAQGGRRHGEDGGGQTLLPRASISFTGNGSTRDKVIRREIHMNEGDVFNTEALKLSIKRINQLGYFKPMESAPEIGRAQEAENKVDVTFKVEEQNRNQFTFGGGFSGLRGRFRQRLVRDHELPRRGRDAPGLRPDRRSHAELLAVGDASPTSSTGRSPPALDLFKRRINHREQRQRDRLHQRQHGGDPRHRLRGGQVVARLPPTTPTT